MSDLSESVKHLRLIHFTLIIVCLVLIVSRDLDETSKAANAYKDVSTIVSAAKKWGDDPLEHRAEEFIKKRESQKSEPNYFFIEFKFNAATPEGQSIFPPPEGIKKWSGENPVSLIAGPFAYTDWFIPPEEKLKFPSKPTTLTDFKKLWDEILKPYSFYAIKKNSTQVNNLAHFTTARSSKLSKFLKEDSSYSVKVHGLNQGLDSVFGCNSFLIPHDDADDEKEFKEIPFQSLLNPSSVHTYTIIRRGYGHENQTDVIIYDPLSDKSLKQPGRGTIRSGYAGGGPLFPYIPDKNKEQLVSRSIGKFHLLEDCKIKNYFLTIRFDLITEVIPLPLSLFEFFRPGNAKWDRSLSFDNNFFDLIELAQYIPSTNLNDLKKHFGNLAKKTGKQIEILGVKLPVPIFNFWGPLIVLSIQLYFFVHFQYVINSLRNEKVEHLKFPWIGVYREWLPQLVFRVSAFVLPIFVIYLPYKNKLLPPDWATGHDFFQQDVVIGWAKLLCSITLAVSAAYLHSSLIKLQKE